MPEEQTKDKNKEALGMVVTFLAGTLWGFSGTCSQFMFENFGITPIYLTSVRMLVSGLVLCLIATIKYRASLKALLGNPKTAIGVMLFGIGGILFNQLSYLQAISYTNSGTATILQYIGPVFIMMVSCVLERRLPRRGELIAIILVIVGTWLIATHGDFGSLYITPKGLFWGLLSALAVVFYTMLPIKLIQKFGSIPVVGVGMLFGGTTLALLNRFQGGPQIYEPKFMGFLAIVIVIGTIIPYTAYLYGVSLCGAVKGSMVASIEPVSATVCMVVWLGEAFYAMDFVGFVCIFLTVFILAKESSAEGRT